MATYDELIQTGHSRGEALRKLAGTTVPGPAGLTSPADMAATYVEADIQALRNDISALRSTVNSLIQWINTGG